MTDNTVLDALEDIYNLRTEDKDGNYVLWVGETSFVLLEKAIPIYKAEQAVVEAACDCHLYKVYLPPKLRKAIDNLKEVRHDR